MKRGHPDDAAIQQYVLDASICDKHTVAHIEACATCNASAEAYRLLISGIGQQPVPAFDFDLAGLVISRIPAPASKARSDRPLAWIFILCGISFAAVIIYLFRDYLSNVFAGVSAFISYLAIVTVVTVLVILIIDMYRTYRKKMKSLNLFEQAAT